MIVSKKWYDMIKCYIGLGSNIEPKKHMAQAIALLEENFLSVRSSSLYFSQPYGPVEQDDFINAVAEILTDLTPMALLLKLKGFEADMGRDFSAPRWGPRCIDFDILTYGDQEIALNGLVIPHPDMINRDFVLKPLAQLAPSYVVPGLSSVQDLLLELA